MEVDRTDLLIQRHELRKVVKELIESVPYDNCPKCEGFNQLEKWRILDRFDEQMKELELYLKELLRWPEVN
jgi:hypothetical protein